MRDSSTRVGSPVRGLIVPWHTVLHTIFCAMSDIGTACPGRQVVACRLSWPTHTVPWSQSFYASEMLDTRKNLIAEGLF